MRKILFLCLVLPLICCQIKANELTEDYFDIAENYCIEGNYNEALGYLDKILTIEPSNNKAKNLKTVILRISSPQSISYLSSHNNQVREAVELKKAGNKSKELSILSNAVLSNPQNYWACYYLAEFYRANREYNNALIYYQKSLQIKPNFTQCYLDMAVVNLEKKSYNTALQNINKYLETNRNADIAYAIRSRINLNSGNFNSAENDIKTALKINEDISYRLLEAKILFHKKDYEKARDKFEVLSKEIKTSEVYKYLGLCDYELGNYTNALLNLDKAIILSDDDKALNLKYNEIKEKLEKR